MLSYVMTYHFIYKTTHRNGKYYIGRHSTEDLDDGYLGSGTWIKRCKKENLSREVVEWADDGELVIEAEQRWLDEHFGKPKCKNRSPVAIGFAPGQHNPMKDPKIAAKISGDNHWLAKNPERKEDFRKQQNKLVDAGKHHFLGDRNPNKDGRNAKLAMERGTHVWLANNPSKWRSEQGIHHWQNGNSPNAGGKLNRKLIEEGRHNFLGPEHNRRMIAEGKNPWVGSASNLKRLAEGTHPSQRKKTCEHCGKESSVGMYKRWHGSRCKTLKGNSDDQ